MQLTIPYWQKLKDPRWQKKRLGILERAHWKCEDCGGDDKCLHVHHCYYERGRDPWDYPDAALKALCESCHELRADYQNTILQELARRDLGELMALSVALHRGVKFNGEAQ